MALAKERSSTTGPDSSSSSHMNFIHVYGNNMYGGTSLVHRQQSISDPSFGFHDHENYTKMVLDDDEEGSDGSEKTSGSGGNKNYYTMNRLPFLADPTSSTNIMLNEDMNSSPEESHHHHHNEGLINFKGGFDHWMHSSGSLLSFGERTLPDIHNVYPRIPQEEDESPNWDSVMCTSTDQNYQWSHAKSTSMVEPRIPGNLNSFETTTIKDDQHGVERFGWLYSGGGSDDSLQESGTSETNFLKRPRSDCEIQATKASKKPKPSKNVTPAKDPQSLAAKNRRERISERLKTLQDLVPNGSKVDLVTMLEKAISYVKFLQLQVKVLATDEFWPTQGGKAPEVTQVKEAIDAILSTHRDRRSSSPK